VFIKTLLIGERKGAQNKIVITKDSKRIWYNQSLITALLFLVMNFHQNTKKRIATKSRAITRDGQFINKWKKGATKEASKRRRHRKRTQNTHTREIALIRSTQITNEK